MKKRDWDAQVCRIEALITRWQPLLLPGDWRVQHHYSHEGEGKYTAEVDHRWEYQLATIRWCLPEVAQSSDEVLEEAAVHEFVHCLVGQLKRGRPKDVERVTTALSRAFLRVAEAK